MEAKIISLDELQKLMLSKDKYKLVDVRAVEYYERGHIKGAISLPLNQIYELAEKMLAKNETIVVYCVNYECPASTKAAKILSSLGYENVLDYKGGFLEYRNAKLPYDKNLPLEKQAKTTIFKNITSQGKAITLVGRPIEVGNYAANFKAVNTDLAEIDLTSFGQKIKIITTFVSLDTPVCDLQLKRFNKEVADFAENIMVIAISKDLPFAQQRYCQINAIKNLSLLSDYKHSSFGINYGLLIKEYNLLARSIIILDSDNAIRYIQLVEEVANPPNYEDAMKNLAEIIQNPSISIFKTAAPKCLPCEEGAQPLEKDMILEQLRRLSGWQSIEDKKIVKEFKFKDFIEAKYFLDLLALIADEQGHHPTFTLLYNKLRVTLTTHVAGGLTDNDFIMARFIDEIVI